MTHEEECITTTARMLEQHPEIQAVIKPAIDCKALRCELTVPTNEKVLGISVQFTDMTNFLPSLRLAVSNLVQKIHASRGLIVDLK